MFSLYNKLKTKTDVDANKYNYRTNGLEEIIIFDVFKIIDMLISLANYAN